MPLQLFRGHDRTAGRYFFESLTVMLQISVHSLRQYCLDLNPSLKTTGALRTLRDPNPAPPNHPACTSLCTLWHTFQSPFRSPLS